MNRDKSWVAEERIVRLNSNRVWLFIRVQTRSRFYELKSSAWDKCLTEEVRISVKNAKLKHAKD